MKLAFVRSALYASPDASPFPRIEVSLLGQLRGTRVSLGQHIYVMSVEWFFVFTETEEPDDGISVIHLDPHFQKAQAQL